MYVISWILIVRITEQKNIYFTQSIYDLWCQENILSNSLLLYPNAIPIGISHTSNIKSVQYELIDNPLSDLFSVRTKFIGDFYFFLLNITRPLEINREYQNVYNLHIQATIITLQRNYTEQVTICLHVADSNDNDAVFDLDVYLKDFSESLTSHQLLIQFHASDADEIQHGQILYELSSFHQLFSLHPLTGELYLLSTENLNTTYEFDIYAYDRHRRYLLHNDMKAKAQVKLSILSMNTSHEITTIFNETVRFHRIVSTYDISVFQTSNWNVMNIHQPILIIETSPKLSSFEIFVLKNSSTNSIKLFVDQNQIYLNEISFQQYDLHLLLCFFHRAECQYVQYRLAPSLHRNSYQFRFKSMPTVVLTEDLPIHSYITHVQIEHKERFPIKYHLLTHREQFQLNQTSGMLRLAMPLKYGQYIVEIQGEIDFFGEFHFVKTIIEIRVKEINKHSPQFYAHPLTNLFQLPYQLRAYDLDEDQETNSRISYRLSNCFDDCPFVIDPCSGLLRFREENDFSAEKDYQLQIIAFDWGQPRSLESRIDLRIDLSSKLIVKVRNNQSIPNRSASSSIYETIYLDIGFPEHSKTYYLSENIPIHTTIDHLSIVYDAFPIFLNLEKENPFLFVINDTSVPFAIDYDTKTIVLIGVLDREKQSEYHFQVELQLKSTYTMKLQQTLAWNKQNSSVRFKYAKKFYQKLFLSIYIDDVNDNIPQCSSFHNHLYLKENQIQSNIFQVDAYDPDRYENGTISYSLLDYKEYFTINSSTGQINCVRAIDREQIPFLHLQILASDQGRRVQLQSICTTLHVTIMDVNDNPPKFSLANYSFDIFSDLPRETIVGQIYAIDADSSAELLYSISANPWIKINQGTGHLRLKSNLHQLTNEFFNLSATVFDGIHVNQTWISFRVKPFVSAQQPILLSEPAYSVVINQSIPVGTVVTNVYQRLRLISTSIDFIEIIHEDTVLPFAIDEQGSIRLTQSLPDTPDLFYWLSIRLTRYYAHPPHSFIRIYISVIEENFFLPQCLENYQYIKLYDYSVQYPFINVQAVTFYDSIPLHYTIVNDSTNEKIFVIDKQTGFIQLLWPHQNLRRANSTYLLAVRASDYQHQVSVDCYLKVKLVQRLQLTPKFIHSSVYNIDLVDASSSSTRIRQRLFQVIALLDNDIYEKNLEVRYRITDTNHYFVINRQTGYIATKQPLYPHTTYHFYVEAFTVAYEDDIEADEDELEDLADRRKWRVVSSRVTLSVQIRIRPIKTVQTNLLPLNQSTIQLVLPTTTKVGATVIHLGMNNSHTQWFLMIGHVDYTRYFHVDFQTGEMILLRPLSELINKTSRIELHINVTTNWIYMNTIKIIVCIRDAQLPAIQFSQTDYYSSVSKNLPTGIEIARLTIENPLENCTYNIHSVEKIKSKDFFRIHPFLGSITIIQSLENSISTEHQLSIVYQCPLISHLAFTRLHITVLDRERMRYQNNNLYRFSHENYLAIFETSPINNQKKYFLTLELINNKNYAKRIKPDAQIIEGDPLGLFGINSSNQSLFLLDESRARSYTYPLRLTIVDTSQADLVTCTVTIFISNINIQSICSLHQHHSPYLFLYKSIPERSVDLFTGQQYDLYRSLNIQGFDSLTSANIAVCSIASDEKISFKPLDFFFEEEFYYGYIKNLSIVYYNNEPLRISIKDAQYYPNPFDITYEFVPQMASNPFHFDPFTGYIKYRHSNHFSNDYSLLLQAKYQSLLTFTRLNILIHSDRQALYEFELFQPLVNNYTIGYLNEIDSNLKVLDRNFSSVFSIDLNQRLFIKDASLLETQVNLYEFRIETARIRINIRSKEIVQCFLTRIDSSTTNNLIGYIEILNGKSKHLFHLLNYNHLFQLDHEYGLLSYRSSNSIIGDDLVLLIDVENARCLMALNQSSIRTSSIVRRNDNLNIDNPKDMNKAYDKIKLHKDLSILNNIIPRFSQRLYIFSLKFPNRVNQMTFIGQVFAQSYNQNRLIYHFLFPMKYFHINPDNGTIYYIPSQFYNQTREQFQVVARDLVSQQKAFTNITIQVLHSEISTLSSSIYHQTISEILPPGSIVFQPESFHTENLQYSLFDYDSNLFEINSNTGQVSLLNHFSQLFYSFKIRISPSNQILIIKLTILDYNNHPPIFLNLPLNLTISSDDVFITKLFAHDLDLLDNTNLTYYLLDKNQQKFVSIEPATGIITLSNPIDQTLINLKVAVSDGWHLTTKLLPIVVYNYSKTPPRFSVDEYAFPYKKILGQINAYDSDPNDRIIYQLHLEPDGIEIDRYSGLITSYKTFFSPTIEFFASARDRAHQITYTKIKVHFPIQPRFTSYLYYIPLVSPIRIPSEIFHFHLVDLFNQPLSSSRFEIDHPTNLLEINQNKLILKQYLHPSKIYQFDINGYWKNFTCQTTIQIIFIEKNMKLNKKSYEYQLETESLRNTHLIENFSDTNCSVKILPTPLTINNCTNNFYLNQQQLYFSTRPILSSICFFELHFTNEKLTFTSQMKISFLPPVTKPKFSSSVYYFYNRNVQVFAKNSNTIRYKLQANPFGLLINQTTGVISFKYASNKLDEINYIQLTVYAIDEKTNLNDTAIVHIILNRRAALEIPDHIPACSNASILISDQSLAGTIIRDISLTKNDTNHYYILSGDKYGMFSINSFGQLYLVSSLLNQTVEEYFSLMILISSEPLSYCHMNISINRTPKWSYFICPSMPIEWTVIEESPLNTKIGNIKDVLATINNHSDLIQLVTMMLDPTDDDSRRFHLDFTTGSLTSTSRLDYEEKVSYAFSVLLQLTQLNCSLPLKIHLINIEDNPISFDQKSLAYTIDEHHPIPFYIGRIELIDLDHLSFFQYKYYLHNSTSQIAIDPMTGSIILLTELDREVHGEILQYEIVALNDFNQKNLIDSLIITINDLNDHGPSFKEDSYHFYVNKSTRPRTFLAQLNATSLDPVNNGRISYYLLNSSSMFSIEKDTGRLYLDEYLPSTETNLTFGIEAIEEEINLTDLRNISITIINDDYIYYHLERIHQCFLEENQPYSTNICTIGKSSKNFVYQLNNSMNNSFDILSTDGTILTRKIFDYERDEHEYNLTILVRDRDNQSILLSSLDLTVYIHNLNDNPPEFLVDNFTTLFFLYSPSINQILYTIEAMDKDHSPLTFEILNNPLSIYMLHSSSYSTELLLQKSTINNQEDHLIIRVSDEHHLFSDLHLHLIYYQHRIDYPKLFSQTIDGYINLHPYPSHIKLGQLFVENQSQYKNLNFHLVPHQSFFLEQISNNQTELYYKPVNRTSSVTFELRLIPFAPSTPVHPIILNNKTKLFFPPMISPQTIHIQLWPISTEMLNRTVSLITKSDPNITREHFLIYHLPSIRQSLAEILSVQAQHVHIYTHHFRINQVEILLAVSRSTLSRYIHRKILYNILKNATHLFEKLILNQCQTNPCENNAHCISHIKLFENQYDYLFSNVHQHLIPNYERTNECLCPNNYYGSFCQFKQDKQTPCSSNPCLTMERCIEHSSTLYTCQCMDDSCNYEYDTMESSLECLNTNSPTCRDSMNALTFDGFASIRMNLTISSMQHLNIALSFRTESIQGKLLTIIYTDRIGVHSLTIQIIDGYIQFKLDDTNLLELNQISIHDGQWHDLYLSTDYAYDYYYYLLRLDHVFSKKINRFQKIDLANLTQLIMGSDFDGCIGNFSFNNRMISFRNDNLDASIEFIGTQSNCQFAEVIREYFDYEDICSSYRPCYYGNMCTNYGLSFVCNCTNRRFTGRQCEIDLHPCESHPCRFNEECFPFASPKSNQSYTCIPTFVSLSLVMKRSIYVALIILVVLCVLLIFMIIYCKKRQDNNNQRNLSVSSPLLIHKSSIGIDQMENQTQTLTKSDGNKRAQAMKTMTLMDNSLISRTHRSNDCIHHSRNTDSKYYSSIEQVNIIPENQHDHYTSIDYDAVNNVQPIDIFDLSSSPTQYFNIHNSDSQINYRIRMNTLSDLTENFLEQNDMNLTDSSHFSSDNDHVQSKPLISIRNGKHVFAFHHHHMPTSAMSLSEVPVYARIVRTPKAIDSDMINPLTSAPTLFIKPIKNANDIPGNFGYRTTTDRFKHDSGPDLYQDDQSSESSAFFQTDV
ncbi:unnamed protein product [Adineta ricciae]|uniref:Uncharacterized protein n=1 Tax=Adineta ricciae TaxID=249248 RepID=A0A813MIL1_ADIRI|nr:unnamed protein product [Adineta ricciae]CAF0785206.1 unnamed protein product [Adineta ricciae]